MNSLVEASCELAYTQSKISTWKTVLHAVLLCFTVSSFYVTVNFLVVPQVNQTFSIWTKSINAGEGRRAKSLVLNYYICNSSACQATGATMTQGLSHNVDPCVDFYQYVCSRWTEEHPLAPFQHRTSADHVAVGMFLQTLKKILNEPSSAPAINFLFDNCKKGDDSLFSGLVNTILYTTGLENWPYMTDSTKEVTKEDVSYKIGSVYRELGLDCFFQFGDEQDTSNDSMRLLSIDQPRLLSDPGIQESVNHYTGMTTAFRTLMDLVDKSEQVNIAGMERKLQALRENPLDGCFMTNECDAVRLSELPALQFINWTVLLFGVTGISEDPKAKRVKVKSPGYLLNLFKDFEPKAVDILNYLVFRVMISVFPLMNSEKHFATLAQWRTENDPNRPLRDSKEDQCLRFMNEFEPLVPMMLAGNAEASEVSRGLYEDIQRKVIAGFIRYIQRNTPLTPGVYNSLAKDVSQIVWEFLYPAYLQDSHNLKRYYEGIYTNNPKTPLVYFYYYYIKNSVQKRRLTFTSDGRKASWSADLFSSWPRFDPPYRTLQVPAAAFDRLLPKDPLLNLFQLPRVAFRLYHNLFRYFHHYVHDGSRRNFTRAVVKFLRECRKCLAGQYRSLLPHATADDAVLNDVLDVLSVRAALNVFRSEVAKFGRDVRLPGMLSYTSDQLFFVRYAMSFCENVSPAYAEKRSRVGQERPSWVRVNGVLKNVPEFSQAFRCNSSAFMSAKKPCVP
ncbi:neprilysin-11-like [Ornithodoros turicata]|uniref:neprilysin-11-like n=1 Tax=Ornithodoros turicata TaxID=34597 RepID=UPI00313A39ED